MHEHFTTFSYQDFLDKNELKTSSVLIKDFLFTSSASLINLECFNYIKADSIYIDLGIGAYIKLSKERTHCSILNFQKVLIPLFLNFIDTVLINNGNGRISEIEQKLKNVFTNVNGCQFTSSIKSLENKPIIYTRLEKNNDVYLDVPTSINNELLKKLIGIINE